MQATANVPFKRLQHFHLPSSFSSCKSNHIVLHMLDKMPHEHLCSLLMKHFTPLKLFHELLKSNKGKRSRLLGLDVGDKYIGLSVSDANNKIATPLSVLVRKKANIHLLSEDFEKLISTFSLSGIVVGYPFDRNNKTCANMMCTVAGTACEAFIDDLDKTEKFEDLKYTFWEECFTSKNVEFLLKPLDLHPGEHKTIVDKFAAVGILQGYLDFANRKVKLA